MALIGHEPALMQEAEDALRRDSLKAISIVADVSIDAEVENAIARSVEALGAVDILINNAAIQPYGTVASTEPAQWDAVFHINLRGAYLACRHALPHMLRRAGGAIVNISSVQALANQARVAAYASSKAGLIALTRSIAVDFGAFGVRANAVCPGCIDAPMTRFAAVESSY